MKVYVIEEHGLESALLGLGLSFGKTSNMTLQDIHDNKDGVASRMLAAARRLAGRGNGHDKFLRCITVSLDCQGSLAWWKQADTYKVGTTAQSESTMHTITARPFTADMFELDEPDAPFVVAFLEVLNNLRQEYVTATDEGQKKRTWRKLIQYMPCSFLQRRIVSANYQVLRTIITQRAGHKLGEWQAFRAGILCGVRHPELLVGENKA